MPWANSWLGRTTRAIGRTVRDTFDRDGNGRISGREIGAGALALGTGWGAGEYGQRSIDAAQRHFFSGEGSNSQPRGDTIFGAGGESGPTAGDVPFQISGDYTPEGYTNPLGTTRRSGWANGGSRRTGGAFATPVGPGATSSERRSNMITGGYNGVGGLLSMGAGRGVLGQSSLSMRNPTVSNQVR